MHKAIALTNQLFALVGAFDRSDEIERDKMGLNTADDLLDWVRTVMRPEFDAIDAAWRLNQKNWVRKL